VLRIFIALKSYVPWPGLTLRLMAGALTIAPPRRQFAMEIMPMESALKSYSSVSYSQ
jgi:hypothetical protein